ncbi:putative calcium-binding protein CML45 [Zea mays]|uniref:Putative calcium-binding protein CML45 n=1 Tax=Zea mays TaxID=4577 RepID=K7UPS9_MAIZE|nr:putative calcium-binding protein CML45 [Zea mays]|eukprot:XP_008680094.1 probable calcium-binding protein CML45 [Zea mays]
MENSSSAAACHCLVLQEPCGINLFLKFLTWSVSVFQILLPCSCKPCNCNCSCSCNQGSAEKVIQTPVITTADKEVTETRNKDQDDETALAQEDIKTVMRNIGFNLDQPENGMAIGDDSVARVFDEDEPSLQEVWQAFSVFDHNNDGYFDASDLQRVLGSLGLREGLGMDECEQMIAKYDTNKDGRIDVAEFTRVLESAGIC